MKRMGLVTIGQTPRVDLTPDIKEILGENVEIIEMGALDGLSKSEITDFYPKDNDEVLVTRLNDGSQAIVAERHIFPQLKKSIGALEKQGVKIIFLACTGHFPPCSSSSLIIQPQQLLHNIVMSIAKDLTLGVVVPNEMQLEPAAFRWHDTAAKVVVQAASPYSDIRELKTASVKLQAEQVDMVVMDCIGYSLDMKALMKQNLDKPVILARSAVARIIKELLL